VNLRRWFCHILFLSSKMWRASPERLPTGNSCCVTLPRPSGNEPRTRVMRFRCRGSSPPQVVERRSRRGKIGLTADIFDPRDHSFGRGTPHSAVHSGFGCRSWAPPLFLEAFARASPSSFCWSLISIPAASLLTQFENSAIYRMTPKLTPKN
jgi:hypothetical protein